MLSMAGSSQNSGWAIAGGESKLRVFNVRGGGELNFHKVSGGGSQHSMWSVAGGESKLHVVHGLRESKLWAVNSRSGVKTKLCVVLSAPSCLIQG
jgi:hypothetical protein